jgi:AcrR family transcriptional regulator
LPNEESFTMGVGPMTSSKTRSSGTARAGSKRLPSAQRRAEIMHRSAQLFQQRGYSGVSIDDIGADLGISGPALYKHVAGKEAILFEIGMQFLDGLLAVADEALVDASEMAPDPALDRLIRSGVEFCLDHPAQVTVTLRHLRSLNEENLARISERWDSLSSQCTPTITAARPDLDPADAGLYVRSGGGALISLAQSRNLTRPTRVELGVAMVTAIISTTLEPSRSGLSPEPEDRAGWERSSRREQILSTAIDLFRERGFHGVSMTEIAEALGVTAGASYRHFKNKEDILATAIVRAGERITGGIEEALDQAVSAEDAVERLLSGYVTIAVNNANLIAVSSTEYHHIDSDAKVRRRRNRQLYVDEWTHCLATTRPDLSTAEAIALVEAVTGIVVESVRSQTMVRRPHLAEDLYRICLATLLPPPSRP